MIAAQEPSHSAAACCCASDARPHLRVQGELRAQVGTDALDRLLRHHRPAVDDGPEHDERVGVGVSEVSGRELQRLQAAPRLRHRRDALQLRADGVGAAFVTEPGDESLEDLGRHARPRREAQGAELGAGRGALALFGGRHLRLGLRGGGALVADRHRRTGAAEQAGLPADGALGVRGCRDTQSDGRDRGREQLLHSLTGSRRRRTAGSCGRRRGADRPAWPGARRPRSSPWSRAAVSTGCQPAVAASKRIFTFSGGGSPAVWLRAGSCLGHALKL